MEANLFGWHWIWSVSEKKRNPDRGEAFQLETVTAAIPQEKRMTLILLSEMTLTAQGDGINVFLNLDFYLQLTARRNKSLVRQREIKWTTERGGQVKQHMVLLTGTFGRVEPRHDAVICVSISSSTVPSHANYFPSRAKVAGISPSSLWWCPADHNQTMTTPFSPP